MRWVIDASFISALFLPDEASERVAALARDLFEEEVGAPGLLQLEMTNIFLLAARRKRISKTQMGELSAAFESLPINFQQTLTASQREDVLRLAEKHDLTAYDAAYLELALRSGAGLVSLDKELVRAATAEKVELPPQVI